jgi:hypothetical protein
MSMEKLVSDLQKFHQDHLALQEIVERQSKQISRLEKVVNTTNSDTEELKKRCDYLLNKDAEQMEFITKQAERIAILEHQNSKIDRLQEEIVELKLISRNTNNSLIVDNDIKVAEPEYFTGNRTKTQRFMLQLNNFFKAQPNKFNTDEKCISYTISLLRGPAFDWVAPYLEMDHKMLRDSREFRKLFGHAFEDINRQERAEAELLEIKQGSKSASELVSTFQRLTLESEVEDSKVLRRIFYNALNKDLKDDISRLSQRPNSIEELYSIAVRLDNRLRERKRETKGKEEIPEFKSKVQSRPKYSKPNRYNTEDKMDIGLNRQVDDDGFEIVRSPRKYTNRNKKNISNKKTNLDSELSSSSSSIPNLKPKGDKSKGNRSPKNSRAPW